MLARPVKPIIKRITLYTSYIKRGNLLKDVTEKNELETNDENNEIENDVEEEEEEPAAFVQSRRGTTILQYKGYRYRKAYSSKIGDKWLCSTNKNCGAFLFLNDEDEIIMAYEEHSHPKSEKLDTIDKNQDDVAVVITSRKGKEILLFRQFTYRKQYEKHYKSRWVCSSVKNCRAVIFTNTNNVVTSAYEEHCHPPPKYYTKADNVLGALREPLILESDQ